MKILKLKRLIEEYDISEKMRFTPFLMRNIATSFARLGIVVVYNPEKVKDTAEKFIAYKGKKYLFNKDMNFLNKIDNTNNYSHEYSHKFFPYVAQKIGVDIKNIQKYMDVEHISGSMAEISRRELEELELIPPPSNYTQFIRLLRGADWSYEYADDHRSWASGQSQMTKLKSLFKTLTPEEKAQAFAAYKKFYPQGNSGMDASMNSQQFEKWFEK